MALARYTKKTKARATKKDVPISLAHLNDSLGYELPHAVSHIRKALQATDPALLKRNLEHASGHVKAAMEHNKKLTQKLSLVPSVKRVIKELKRDSKMAGGS